MNFIPAQESRFHIWFFEWYTRHLINRRFKSVWLKQNYSPNKDSKTVYFLNHNLWWDGLLPLYLNDMLFNQKPRAVMEDKQMIKHRFFSKIGAFSINLTEHRSVIQTLRYAVDSMNRENASLYIFPEGELIPAGDSKPNFKQGLSWLYKNLNSEIDFVPVTFYAHTFRNSKPELYINIGSKAAPDRALSKTELTKIFEDQIYRLLTETRSVAGFSDTGFTRI